MASAGRILIMPKGNYDSSVTYEMLDLVKHNGTSWIAKKTSVGIEPSDANTEYWQDVFDSTYFTNEVSKISSRFDEKISFKWDEKNNRILVLIDETEFGYIPVNEFEEETETT